MLALSTFYGQSGWRGTRYGLRISSRVLQGARLGSWSGCRKPESYKKAQWWTLLLLETLKFSNYSSFNAGQAHLEVHEHMQRGKERSPWRTTKSNDFDLFVPFCHRSLLGRLVSHPQKSIEKGQAYMFYEMISAFIYAMPCIVFVCLYWAFFTSAPCALLRFIEERALSWEWKARASDRKDSPSRELLENGEIISERRTNDDPILKEKEE